MNEIIVKRDQQTQLQSIQALNWHELYQRFINYVDVSDNTIRTYTTSIKQFFVYLGKENITNPKREDVIAYREYLKETGKKSTTIQNYIVALKQFFNWLEAEGIYQNISKNVKGVKISRNFKKDYLTADQVNEVLNAIDTSTLKGLRDYALIALVVTCGLRTIEIVRADIQDLRVAGASNVLYIQGKGRDDKQEYVKIEIPVERAIRAYLQARGKVEPEAPLFASTSNNNKDGRMTTRTIRGIVKQSFRAIGLDSDRLTAHSLRHTTATLNLLNGGTIEETQELLRHRNIANTLIYSHHLNRADNMSERRVANAIFE